MTVTVPLDSVHFEINFKFLLYLISSNDKVDFKDGSIYSFLSLGTPVKLEFCKINPISGFLALIDSFGMTTLNLYIFSSKLLSSAILVINAKSVDSENFVSSSESYPILKNAS